jgi:hypothetical protein
MLLLARTEKRYIERECLGEREKYAAQPKARAEAHADRIDVLVMGGEGPKV